MIEIADHYFASPGIRLGNKLFIYIVCRLLAEETGYQLKTKEVLLLRKYAPDRLFKFEDCEGKIITDKIIPFDDSKFYNKNIKEFANELLESNAGAFAGGYYLRYDLIKPYKDRVKHIYKNVFQEEIRNDNEIVLMLRNSRMDLSFRLPDEYYLSILENCNFNTLYITCDELHRHETLLEKLKKYNPIILEGDAIQQMNYVMNFKTIIASQGTFSFWAAFLSKANKIYWPITTIGPNSRHDGSVNLLVDDDDRYTHIEVDNI